MRVCSVDLVYVFFFFKQKTAYEMRISDWSSDVCSSDLVGHVPGQRTERVPEGHPQASHHAGTGDELLGAGHRRHRGLSFGAEEVSRVMTRSASLLAIALASALVLAGCSGSDTPAGHSSDRKSTRLNSSH